MGNKARNGFVAGHDDTENSIYSGLQGLCAIDASTAYRLMVTGGLYIKKTKNGSTTGQVLSYPIFSGKQDKSPLQFQFGTRYKEVETPQQDWAGGKLRT